MDRRRTLVSSRHPTGSPADDQGGRRARAGLAPTCQLLGTELKLRELARVCAGCCLCAGLANYLGTLRGRHLSLESKVAGIFPFAEQASTSRPDVVVHAGHAGLLSLVGCGRSACDKEL